MKSNLSKLLILSLLLGSMGAKAETPTITNVKPGISWGPQTEKGNDSSFRLNEPKVGQSNISNDSETLAQFCTQAAQELRINPSMTQSLTSMTTVVYEGAADPKATFTSEAKRATANGDWETVDSTQTVDAVLCTIKK